MRLRSDDEHVLAQVELFAVFNRAAVFVEHVTSRCAHYWRQLVAAGLRQRECVGRTQILRCVDRRFMRTRVVCQRSNGRSHEC